MFVGVAEGFGQLFDRCFLVVKSAEQVEAFLARVFQKLEQALGVQVGEKIFG